MKRDNTYGTRPKLDVENHRVTVEIYNKNTDEVIDTGVFAIADVNANLRANVALYGLSKLIQDRSSDVPVGPDKLEAMRGVFQQLVEGVWQRERARGAPVVRIEVEALAALRGVSVSAIQKALSAYSKEQREDILSHPDVVARANEMRGEREEEVADLDLGDLMSATA